MPRVLLAARMVLVIMGLAAPTPSQLSNAMYELIHQTDSTTHVTGSIIMKCRDGVTVEDLPLSEVHFWLNRSRARDPSLRERPDINVIEVDNSCIKFNLTHRLEGYYTCGKRVHASYVMESSPKAFISFQTIIPMPDKCQSLNFTALSGDRVVLPCPIPPGALIEYYSVTWMKDNVRIAEASNPQTVRKTDCRYNIDRATYALIIDPVNISDTSTTYQCQVYSQNPITDTKIQLRYAQQPISGVFLSLHVIDHEQSRTFTIPNTNITCTCHRTT